jgi:hypothetical protein
VLVLVESRRLETLGLQRLGLRQRQARLAIRPKPTERPVTPEEGLGTSFGESCEWRPLSASADRQALPQQCLLPQTSRGNHNASN